MPQVHAQFRGQDATAHCNAAPTGEADRGNSERAMPRPQTGIGVTQSIAAHTHLTQTHTPRLILSSLERFAVHSASDHRFNGDDSFRR